MNPTTTPPENYGAALKLLHWLMVLLVAAAWALGTFGDELPKGAARDTGLFIHISAGLAILALVLVRIPLRAAGSTPPPEPARFGATVLAWTVPASRVVQLVLYALLVGVPLVGIMVQFAKGHALPVFGITTVASPLAADKALADTLMEVHEILANTLLALALMHMAAALLHHWVLRDQTLIRMLPRSRRQA